MSPLPQRLAFSIANTGAVLVALYIAFARDLERPYWAMFSVFIVAQPISGAVRSKAVYRFCGTLVGATVAVFLIPPLVHVPVLLSLAMSGWVGLCLYTSLLDRTPRSYAFLLAGYSAAIIGFSVVDTPQSVFDTAVARVEEISLGIVCGAVAHSIFFPKNVAAELREKIAATLEGCAAWIATALGREHRPEDVLTEQRLPQVVTSLHLLYTHVAFETSDVPRANRIMRTLQDRLAVLLPRLSTVQTAVATLRANAMLRAPIVRVLESASRWARDFGAAAAGAMGPAVEKHEPAGDWQSLLEQTVIINVAELVTALEDSRLLARALEHPETRLPPRLEREVATPGRRYLHRDRGLALLSAFAAAGAVLVACVLWIEGTWPEGTVAAQFAAIGCSLFATLDNPAKVITAAIVGILVALPIGAVYEFAIIPRIDGFASLTLVLAPVLLLFSAMQTFEKLEGAALVLAIGFSGSLALQSSYRADFSSFVNSNTAEIAGLLIAVVMNLVFRTIDPVWNALRISRAGWRSVSRLARDGRVDIRGWTLQMFDRLGLVTARLKNESVANVERRHIDGLRDIRVGMNVAALRDMAPRSPGFEGVLGLIARTYAARAELAVEPPQTEFERTIDTELHAVATPEGFSRQADGVAALTALRLDLAPAAPPYARTAGPEPGAGPGATPAPAPA